MGLFGLFVSMVGLGAMTKDAIKNNIYTEKNYRIAKANNKPYYFGSGSKIYSTKTGNQVVEKLDLDDNHNYLFDLNTGKKVEDLTVLRNNKRTDKSKTESQKNGSVFYVTHEFDNAKKMNDSVIYRSFKIPGYFIREHKYEIGVSLNIYKKGELIDKYIGNSKTVNTYKSNESYFEDGTPYSVEEYEIRINDKSRETAIKNGEKIFKIIDSNIKSYYGYRDVETNEMYWLSKKYIGGYQKSKIINGLHVIIETEPVYDLYGKILS